MATTLLRKPLVLENIPDVLIDSELAGKAFTLLKYSGANRFAADLTRRSGRRQQLELFSDILKALDINPLDPQAVAKYKREQEQLANRVNLSTSMQFKWESVSLAVYTAPIPQFVLARAVQVAEALREKIPDITAEFYVDELRSFRKPDPFLYLLIADTRVYLDVWDEPEFEGRRTI